MKTNRSKFSEVVLTFLSVIFYTLLPAPDLCAGTAVIPGDIERVCFYTDFFYHFPPGDFVYYLNDRLLFREKPDGMLTENGLRNKLLKIVQRHKVIKESLPRFKRDESGMITVSVAKSTDYTKALALLNLMGLRLEKAPAGGYLVTAIRDLESPSSSSPAAVDYSRFALLGAGPLNRRLNKKGRFSFRLKESEIHVPWDYKFLQKITGLKIDSTSFFETMLKNERFSLLLGVLYRLSDREINYIAGLVEKPLWGAWKQVYKDKKFLMGLFVLAAALRVVEDDVGRGGFHWALPGGTAAEDFWAQLAETDYKKYPLEFLRQLATKDEGKLNYLYLFSYFLAPGAQSALFTGTNGKKMQEIYQLVSLTGKEKLNPSQFPGLRDSNFYTLLYALRMRDNRFYLPPGADCWIKAIGNSHRDADASGGAGADPDVFDLLRELLERTNGDKKPVGEIHKFVSLYTKFSHRPHLMTKETISTMYNHYEEYNVLVDFIEKLPIQKPGTVRKLFAWVENFKELEKNEKLLFTSIFQSLLELLSHAAKYAPHHYDYDNLIEKLVNIPLNRRYIYNNLFAFFETGLNIKAGKKSLIDVILAGIDNRVVNIDNTDYKFAVKDMYRKKIEEILQTQAVCSLSDLQGIRGLFKRLLAEQGDSSTAGDIIGRICDAFHRLPYAEISDEAPRTIRERVMPYSRTRLTRKLTSLQKIKNKKKAAKKDLRAIIEALKKDYLLHQLRDYLLTFAYAVNAKDPRLRVFLNPNLVRLHDFDEHKERTAWNDCGTAPDTGYFSGFHFCGGLSRLNVVFADKWLDHLFSRTRINNSAHVQSVIMNLLDSYPVHVDAVNVNRPGRANAGLVDLGWEQLRKARHNEVLRRDVIKELSTITAGYHYRKAMRYLTGKAIHHHLFSSELKRLGERFSAPHRFGGIYYRTFGSLKPRQTRLFPQDAANFFAAGWVGGEMVNEFKIKLSRHLYKKKIPLYLLGQVLYSHFNKTAVGFFSQNHVNDYFSTYFIADIFNDAHLKNILKNLQKEGYLKLK